MGDGRVLVVGGNAAGMTAASRAKRLNPNLDVSVLEAGERIAYSICGLPYFLGGRVADIHELELFTPETLLNERGIEARVSTRVVAISPTQRKVDIEDLRSRKRERLGYDKLLVATGYRPRRLDVDGMDSDGPQGVFTASRLSDGEALTSWLSERSARNAVLVGGGYVGLELAEALVKRGLRVTLVDEAPQLFSALDPDMARRIEDTLSHNGVHVMTGRRVQRIESNRQGVVEAVELAEGALRLRADLVFADIGVEPEVSLAKAAGIELGRSGAIAVNERMETSAAGVYAAGNCVETLHLVSGRPGPIPLGTVAAKQGRVAGENLAGRRSHFRGAVGTSVVKVFDMAAARTGLSSAEAAAAGLTAVEATIEGSFRAHYFGDAKGVVKVIAERDSGRLLGAQIVGSDEAVLRIDAAAVALTARMTVHEASQLDLGYVPPLGVLWNPFLVALNTLARSFH